MSHLDEVIARVDAAIEESVIAHMNELLIALSDDAELSREDRYTQQQRLRTAIAHHGRKHKEDMEAPHSRGAQKFMKYCDNETLCVSFHARQRRAFHDF